MTTDEKALEQGYNPWNAFHTDINETVILETVDLMLSLGLVEAGYTNFNLDGPRLPLPPDHRLLCVMQAKLRNEHAANITCMCRLLGQLPFPGAERKGQAVVSRGGDQEKHDRM